MLRFPVSVWVLPIILLLTPSCSSGGNDIYEKTSKKTLSDILEDAEFSITEHNLRIVDQLHIGQAIRERGNKQFPDFEIILYCNLTFAEKILSLAPDMINICPGRITVRGAQDLYIISAPLWPEHNDNAALNRLMLDMNGMVRTIVDYAAADWPDPPGK